VLMKLYNIEKTIDKDTFQPKIKFSGEISIELKQDMFSELDDADLYKLVGKMFIDEIKNGLTSSF